jgi:hypothetical protein
VPRPQSYCGQGFATPFEAIASAIAANGAAAYLPPVRVRTWRAAKCESLPWRLQKLARTFSRDQKTTYDRMSKITVAKSRKAIITNPVGPIPITLSTASQRVSFGI